MKEETREVKTAEAGQPLLGEVGEFWTTFYDSNDKIFDKKIEPVRLKSFVGHMQNMKVFDYNGKKYIIHKMDTFYNPICNEHGDPISIHQDVYLTDIKFANLA